MPQIRASVEEANTKRARKSASLVACCRKYAPPSRRRTLPPRLQQQHVQDAANTRLRRGGEHPLRAEGGRGVPPDAANTRLRRGGEHKVGMVLPAAPWPPQIRASVEEANTRCGRRRRRSAGCCRKYAPPSRRRTPLTSIPAWVASLPPQIRASVEEANTDGPSGPGIRGSRAANTRLRRGGEHSAPHPRDRADP